MDRQQTIRAYIILNVTFRNFIVNVDFQFLSRAINIYSLSELPKIIIDMYDSVMQVIENHAFDRSGFTLVGCKWIDAIVSRSYFVKPGGHYIPIPKGIACRNATINPKNTSDNKCFMQAVLASLHKHEIRAHPERISVVRKFVDNYDWTDTEFSIEPNEIRMWESKNNIRVNILGYQDEQIHIMKNDADNPRFTKTVNLMLRTDEDTSHYIAITDIEKLLSFMVNKDGHRKFI